MPRAWRFLILAVGLWTAACTTDRDPAGPDPVAPPPGLLESAIRLRVDLRTGRIEVVAASRQPAATEGDIVPSFALLGRNEIGVEASNFTRTPAGLGRVRIRFDLKVVNRLTHTDLVTPTFPAPPAGVTGAILFPFRTVALGASGAPLPLGDVRATPSVDWNGTGAAGSGAPHNFFNSTLCLPVVGDDCFRWEAFGTVAAGATTAARQVGFDADLGVFGIDVYVVLAADLKETPLTGAVGGTITSAMFGPVQNAQVTVTPGGGTGASNAAGNYLIGGLTPGSKTVSVRGPASCFSPAAQTVSVAAGATADADFSLTCRPIVYTRHFSGVFEIFSIRADGSGQTNLTNDGGFSFDPHWSPDASRIAFVARNEIAVMNADGSARDTLTDDTFDDLEPAWSPDGSRIAYVSFHPPQTDIWLINADGTGQTQLTATAGSERNPTWSPDGTQIAFELGGNIWRLNLASPGTPTNITPGNPFTDAYPAWSPDGSKIAFIAASEADDGEGSADHTFEVYTMNPDGSGRTRITTDDNFDIQPAWSPDGSTIVFVNGDGPPILYTVSATGGTPVQLTPSSQSSDAPHW